MDPLIGKCDEVAGLLKELAHPQRLQMLCHLVTHDKTVSELKALCGVSQSRVSQFLGHMKSAGLVSARRDGKFVHYQISNSRVRTLIKALRRIYCP